MSSVRPESAPTESDSPRRKPYRRPRVLSVEPMELVAAVCTPVGKADLGACPGGPINS